MYNLFAINPPTELLIIEQHEHDLAEQLKLEHELDTLDEPLFEARNACQCNPSNPPLYGDVCAWCGTCWRCGGQADDDCSCLEPGCERFHEAYQQVWIDDDLWIRGVA